MQVRTPIRLFKKKEYLKYHLLALNPAQQYKSPHQRYTRSNPPPLQSSNDPLLLNNTRNTSKPQLSPPTNPSVHRPWVQGLSSQPYKSNVPAKHLLGWFSHIPSNNLQSTTWVTTRAKCANSMAVTLVITLTNRLFTQAVLSRQAIHTTNYHRVATLFSTPPRPYVQVAVNKTLLPTLTLRTMVTVITTAAPPLPIAFWAPPHNKSRATARSMAQT
jgi:hypothetical protein